MEPEPAAVTPSPPPSSDPQPGHEGKGSPRLAPAAPPSFGPAAVVGSLAAIGALGGQSGLADPGAFGGRQVTGGARKQQPAKPVPLRPPLGMAQQQQQQQQQGALLRVKQNPDEDADDASSSDSDDDGAHMVPQMGGAGGAMQLAGGGGGAMQQYGTQPRKRGGDRTEEKERKRLKRLLRNRVSAQQARERKKAYLTDLEARSRELEQKNAELEERVSTLQRENFMLRQIVKNTTMKKGSQATPS